MVQFANCMRIIAVCFENHSIHISREGMYKSEGNLICTVAIITCGWRRSVEHSSY